MRRKILELSSQLAAEPSAAALALGEAEVAAGGVLDTLLERWGGETIIVVCWLYGEVPGGPCFLACLLDLSST